MALIYDRIGFVSAQPLQEKYRLQGYKHQVVTGLSEIITEDGEDSQYIISKTWTSQVRRQALSVVIKGKVHKLLPAYKIERGLELHHITKAFGEIEKLFLKKMKEDVGENPEEVLLEILDRYPNRLAKNEYFRPLKETNYKPNYK